MPAAVNVWWKGDGALITLPIYRSTKFILDSKFLLVSTVPFVKVDGKGGCSLSWAKYGGMPKAFQSQFTDGSRLFCQFPGLTWKSTIISNS